MEICISRFVQSQYYTRKWNNLIKRPSQLIPRIPRYLSNKRNTCGCQHAYKEFVNIGIRVKSKIRTRGS